MDDMTEEEKVELWGCDICDYYDVEEDACIFNGRANVIEEIEDCPINL